MSPWLVCSTARRAGVDSVTAPLCHRSSAHERPGPVGRRCRAPRGTSPAPFRLPCGRLRRAPEVRVAPDETLVDRGFLAPATPSPAADQLFAADRADFGYVMNLSHASAHQPAAHDG